MKWDYPKGVFNLVLGRGETVGQELAGNPKVAMVSMTGSVVAGEKNHGRGGEKYHQSLPRTWVAKPRLSFLTMPIWN